MPEVLKAKRLGAVAKELNVGKDHIVERLAEAGFELDGNPNTKLTEEMYSLLLRDFQKDKHLKEEADALALNVDEKKDVLIGDKSIIGTRKKREQEEVFIHNAVSPVVAPEEEAKAEEEVEKEPEPEVKERKKPDVKVKVVDKIDLDKDEPAKDEEPEPEVEELPEEEPEEELSEEDIKKGKAEKLEGPKVVGKIELVEPEPKKEKRLVASSTEGVSGEKKKRRRKRIRPKVEEEGGDRKKRTRRDEEKTEISEKEIEEKIKATMAKLGAGAKSKSVRSKLRRAKREHHAEIAEEEAAAIEQGVLQVTEFISVAELASMLGVTVPEIISTCMNLGIIVSINQRLDAEVIELVAEEFGNKVEFIAVEEQDEEFEEVEDDESTLKTRAPIVTIMGHVDHGKTSLLDYIRSASVVAGEVGGITQHIGAYEVSLEDGKEITFLDTPGHEAFTAMRARGAKITDIAVIVVAADDAIMPQTKEAISHAQAAGVPMIFAINKVDKEQADPEKIKEQLANMNLQVEDWGGKYQSQDISAKSGLNVRELLEKILVEAELLDLKANPDKPAIGSIVEASLDKGRGFVATVLVQEGTLSIGDLVLAGSFYGRVKAMTDERGRKVKAAGPSTPVQVLGINGAPQAGEKFRVMEDEQEAKNVAAKRQRLEREQGLRAQKHITLDEIGRRLALGSFKELNLIIKGDVDGSIEALSDSLLKLSTDEIQVNIVHSGVGQITESDVLLASASDAIVIGFQVRPSLTARKEAEKEHIEIRLYSIIYDAIEEIKSAMEGMLEPKVEEKITGNAEVREVFKISKVGTVAGCFVQDGLILKSSKVRLIRDGIVVYTGELSSLKRFKDDAKEVKSGLECGMTIKGFNDLKVGDVIEAFEEVEVKRTLA